jgi:sugar-phosphatase
MASIVVKGILFDLDGVLVESTAGVARVWREWAVAHDLDPAMAEHTAHGRRAIETVRLLAPRLDADAELRELERREIEESYDAFAYPGARELLATLPPERWAIVTSGTRCLARHRLNIAGLPIPERFVTGTEMEVGKPHPAPYLRGAKLLGFWPPSCVVIEDAPSGLRSAAAAGIPALAVPTTYPAEELTSALAILPALSALRVQVEEDSLRLEW